MSARAALRGVLVAAGFLAAARAVDAPWPAASVLYVGFLAAPLALLEARLIRRRVRAGVLHVALGFAVVWLAAWAAHLQGVYAQGALGTGTLAGGLAAVDAEVARWRLLCPGPAGWELGLRNVEWDGLALTGAAVALTVGTLVRPLLAATGLRPVTRAGRVLEVLWAWVVTAVFALGAGSAAVAVVAGLVGGADHFFVAAVLAIFWSLLPCAVMALVRAAEHAIARTAARLEAKIGDGAGAGGSAVGPA